MRPEPRQPISRTTARHAGPARSRIDRIDLTEEAPCRCRCCRRPWSDATPSPEWLIDRAKLAGRFPPRVRAKELWRVPPEHLDEAQDDATIVAIRAAGARPGSTSSPTARSAARATATTSPPRSMASTSTTPAPRSTAAATRTRCRASSARSRRPRPVEVARPAVPARTHRPDDQDDRARAVHDVASRRRTTTTPTPRRPRWATPPPSTRRSSDLFAAGADIVQIDEPYLQARPDAARAYGLDALNAALDGVTGTTAVHICFGYAAIIHERPEGYSFLPELAGCPADQISIETAQSGPRPRSARRPRRQDDHPRRDRPVEQGQAGLHPPADQPADRGGRRSPG